MAKTAFKSVDEYLATQPAAVKLILSRVRSTIRKAVPGATEVISYQIPAYKLHGGIVVFFAGWKEHYSLYPATDRVVETFAKELAPYEVSRGTIRFPYSQPIPTHLIERIAQVRADETAERTKAASMARAAKKARAVKKAKAPTKAKPNKTGAAKTKLAKAVTRKSAAKRTQAKKAS